MELALRRYTQSHPTLLYYLDVDLSSSVVRPQRVTLEVHRRSLNAPHGVLREVFFAEAAGFRLEAGNVANIVRLVQKFLPALVNWARLPDYVFLARRSQRIYPVYTYGDEVIATTPGGPTFRHVELAKVRRWLNDYGHQIGELGVPGKSEKLHVRGVSRDTLKLLRPIFYLKKRMVGLETPWQDGAAMGYQEFWAPVFQSEDGQHIYTYAASAKREVAMDSGHEVLALRNVVAEALIADGRLRHNHDLRIDRLMPQYWERLQATLKIQSRALNAGQTATASGSDIPVYRNSDLFVAAEDRRDEHRWSLYVGSGTEELRDRVAADFVRRNLIATPEAVRIVSTRRPHQTSTAMSVLDQILRREDVETLERSNVGRLARSDAGRQA